MTVDVLPGESCFVHLLLLVPKETAYAARSHKPLYASSAPGKRGGARGRLSGDTLMYFIFCIRCCLAIAFESKQRRGNDPIYSSLGIRATAPSTQPIILCNVASPS